MCWSIKVRSAAVIERDPGDNVSRHRFQSHIPSLCVAVLHYLHIQHRQRTHHSRNCPSLRRSARPVFRKRLRTGPHLQLSESLCCTSRPFFDSICALITLCLQILDELIIAGELQDSSKKSVLRVVSPSPGFPLMDN
jgi:hypothetical protein